MVSRSIALLASAYAVTGVLAIPAADPLITPAPALRRQNGGDNFVGFFSLSYDVVDSTTIYDRATCPTGFLFTTASNWGRCCGDGALCHIWTSCDGTTLYAPGTTADCATEAVYCSSDLLWPSTGALSAQTLFWCGQTTDVGRNMFRVSPTPSAASSSLPSSTPSSQTTGSSSSASNTGSATSSSASNTGTGAPPPPSGGTNVGAIAGGVVGGVAVLAIAAGAIFFLMRRKKQDPAAGAAVAGAPGPHQQPPQMYQQGMPIDPKNPNNYYYAPPEKTGAPYGPQTPPPFQPSPDAYRGSYIDPNAIHTELPADNTWGQHTAPVELDGGAQRK